MVKYKQVDGVKIQMTEAEIDSFALVQDDAEASNLVFKNEQLYTRKRKSKSFRFR